MRKFSIVGGRARSQTNNGTTSPANADTTNSVPNNFACLYVCVGDADLQIAHHTTGNHF
jgi:hypothetical protein